MSELPIQVPFERNAYGRYLEYLEQKGTSWDTALFDLINLAERDERYKLSMSYPAEVHAHSVMLEHGVNEVAKRAGDHPLAKKIRGEL